MYSPGIAAFLAIVRTQSLSRAAAQLNLAQSTISKRLKVLEDEIGIPLIERGKGLRSIQLTASGAAFVELAERWAALWQETRTLYADGPRLSLSIATLDSLVNSTFPALFRVIRKTEPRLSLNVKTSHSVDVYYEIDRQTVDVAFSLLDRNHPNVVVRPCYREEMVVLRRSDANREIKETVNPDELDGNAELYVRWGPVFQLWHDKLWDPAAPGRIQLDTSQLILRFLTEPEQWSVVPYSVAKQAQETGYCSIHHLSAKPPVRTVYLLTHKHPPAGRIQSLAIFEKCLDTLLSTEFSWLERP